MKAAITPVAIKNEAIPSELAEAARESLDIEAKPKSDSEEPAGVATEWQVDESLINEPVEVVVT